MKKPKLKALNLFSYIVLVFTFAFLCLMGYWLIYPYKTIEVKSIKVLTPVVVRGEDLRIEVHYIKYTNSPAEYNKDLINGDIVHIDTGKSNVPCGEHTVVIHQRIPMEADLGEARMKETLQYQINPIRTITKEFITEPFEIMDGTKSIK